MQTLSQLRMRHYIIGTAGHIDHGKTALIKALTNIDCDTHPEEKKRGITINPGFAYLKQSEDNILAFVDVPGHQKFIHNMIAGSSGVDFVMLVIAADDGIMPQTIEHLKICSLLGIQSGITVINKCDSVSDDYLALCKDEVAHFIKGTFLEHKPLFCVSALKGTGMESLRDYLLQGGFEVLVRERQDFFRMYVDRLFQVAGFGYIATGTALGNEVKVGDPLTILPKKKKVKVRNIQRHGESVPSCMSGSRLALDLTGIKREDIAVGNIICHHEIPPTQRIDAKLTFMDEDNRFTHFEALLFTGTHRCRVGVKWMHTYEWEGKKEVIAQLALDAAWYFTVNDHFILRNTANDQTIAGGFVVDPLPLVHKKTTGTLIDALLPAIKNPMAYMLYKVEQSMVILTASFFSNILQLTEEHIIEMIERSDGLMYIKHGNSYLIFSRKQFGNCYELIAGAIHEYHTRHPLSLSGIDREYIQHLIKNKRIYKDHKSNELALNLFIAQMEKEELLVQNNNKWNTYGYEPAITPAQLERIKTVETTILHNGFEGVYESDLLEFKDILDRLAETKTIYRLNNKLFHANKVSDAKALLYKHLTAHTEGIKVTEFRELLNTNRKIAMSYLDILEKEGFIFRDGDFRFLL